MVTANLDRLFESLLHLSPAERAQVRARLDRLDPTSAQPGRFRALSGVISPADAALMREAGEECERVDARGW